MIREQIFNKPIDYSEEELEMMWQKKHLIDKACEWLYNNAEDYTIDGGLSIENLVYSFKKAMEEKL